MNGVFKDKCKLLNKIDISQTLLYNKKLRLN